VSRKSVPKEKGGIPLDKLLAAHATGSDARLDRLVERYGRDVVPASSKLAPATSSTVTKPATTPTKQRKTSPKRARLTREDDSQVAETRSPRLVGYARVSTDEQTTALQLDALRAAGCSVIHQDAASGALRSRPGLERAIADLAPGDTLVVWKLDRLGRSLRHLLDSAETLRERGAALRSLTEHIDTGTAAGQMLYSVLGAVAQFERDVLRERTVAGLAAAKRRGERLGRPFALTPAQIREAKKMLARGESPNNVARVLRVGRSTLYRAIAL
jgi:DNA invertase Pin-like site-specific DNA recombinase